MSWTTIVLINLTSVAVASAALGSIVTTWRWRSQLFCAERTLYEVAGTLKRRRRS